MNFPPALGKTTYVPVLVLSTEEILKHVVELARKVGRKLFQKYIATSIFNQYASKTSFLDVYQ